MIDQETTIKLANEAGIEFQQHQGVSGKVSVTTCGSQRVERMQAFAQAAYLRGLEDAAKVCDALKEKALTAQGQKSPDDPIDTNLRMIAHLGNGACAEAIRALKEQQHG